MQVGANVRITQIGALFALADWLPQTGHDKLTGMTELSISTAWLKVRPTLPGAGYADGSAKAWAAQRVE